MYKLVYRTPDGTTYETITSNPLIKIEALKLVYGNIEIINIINNN